MPGHRARGDVVGLQLTTAHPPRDGPRGPRDLFPAAVADGQDDRHAGVPLGRLDGRPEPLADRRRQAAEAPHREQTDLMLHHLAELAGEITAEKRHQPIHLPRRPRPVLGREGVEREVGDAELAARLHDRPHRLLPCPVTVEARQATLLGPAAVAIHDDGDVPRKLGRIALHHQTAMISSSLVLRTFSTRSTYSLVSPSIFSAAWRRSSSVMSLSFSSVFRSSSESRRWLRTDTR